MADFGSGGQPQPPSVNPTPSPPPHHAIKIEGICVRQEGDGAWTYGGMTIWQAATVGVEIIVPILLEGGVDILRERDHDGLEAIHHAAKSGNQGVLEFLLEKEVHVDAEDAGGMTPLMYAVANSHTPCAAFLVKSRANVGAQDASGRTVACHAVASSLAMHVVFRSDVALATPPSLLHTATTAEKYFSVLYCLEQLGMDVNAQNGDGDTALHIAARKGLYQIAGALSAKGADLSLVNNAGATPLQVDGIDRKTRGRIASKNGDPDFSNWKVLKGRDSATVALAALLLPNLFLISAANLPPVLGFVALVANLIMVGFITKRAANMRKPDPGLAGWYAGGLLFGGYVLVSETFPHVDNTVAKYMWFAVTSLMFLNYVSAFLGDPGVVRSTQHDRESLYKDLGADGAVDTAVYCPTSLVLKPFRSKFCSTSQRPVHRFDHYCVWTCNAIGGGNFRNFFMFSFFQVLSQCGVSWFTYQFLANHAEFPTADRWSPCTWFDFFFHPKITLVTFFLVFYNFAVFVFIITVFLTQVFFITRNVTSNEVWFPDRYKWVFKLGTRVYTLYDQGTWGNWREFCVGDYVGYSRTMPAMSAHLSSHVAKYNAWKEKREARLQAGRGALPHGHPAGQGDCCGGGHSHSHGATPASPESKAAVLRDVMTKAENATMTRDTETGLFVPSQMSALIADLPVAKRRTMAEAQTKQLRELGLLGDDNTLQNITPEIEANMLALLRSRAAGGPVAGGGGGEVELSQSSGPSSQASPDVGVRSDVMLRSRSQPSHAQASRGKDD